MTEESFAKGNKLIKEIEHTRTMIKGLNAPYIKSVFVNYYENDREKRETYSFETGSDLQRILIKYFEGILKNQIEELEIL
jgi:hypothetical protein